MNKSMVLYLIVSIVLMSALFLFIDSKKPATETEPVVNENSTLTSEVEKPAPEKQTVKNETPTPKTKVAESCFVGGCSNQICSDQEGVMSTCEYKEEYACYKTAKCERQTSGQCGWTPTAELAACLK